MMSQWVSRLAPAQRGSAAELVGFVGSGDDDQEDTILIELLVLVRGNPTMQLWADCCSSHAQQRILQHPMVLPCAIEITSRVPRLALPDSGRRAIPISTSDEPGRFLLSLRASWLMVLLQCDINTTCRGLHKMGGGRPMILR